MSTYVTSDIHGCFDEFLQLLDKVNFRNDDTLIIAGDYMDRGPISLEMLRWLENCPKNVIALKGNHDVAFADYIGYLEKMAESAEVDINSLGNEQLTKWYYSFKEQLGDVGYRHFDRYGTLRELIEDKGVVFADLRKWVQMIDAMPLTYECEINGRRCIVVHAGYIESLDNPLLRKSYRSLAEFLVWARDDAYQCGGVEHGMIVAGHNPTNEDCLCTYNEGKVYRYYNQEKDCIFYDVDCGGVYRTHMSRFAIMRLEDEEIFYL